MAEKKPLIRMESRDERITVRLTSSQRQMFLTAALTIGVELSRYLRDCALMGHAVFQAQRAVKPTSA